MGYSWDIWWLGEWPYPTQMLFQLLHFRKIRTRSWSSLSMRSCPKSHIPRSWKITRTSSMISPVGWWKAIESSIELGDLPAMFDYRVNMKKKPMEALGATCDFWDALPSCEKLLVQWRMWKTLLLCWNAAGTVISFPWCFGSFDPSIFSNNSTRTCRRSRKLDPTALTKRLCKIKSNSSVAAIHSWSFQKPITFPSLKNRDGHLAIFFLGSIYILLLYVYIYVYTAMISDPFIAG